MTTQATPIWAIKIRALRKQLNENQTQFGKRFGVSQVAVAYWESGRNEPGAEVFMAIIKALEK